MPVADPVAVAIGGEIPRVTRATDGPLVTTSENPAQPIQGRRHRRGRRPDEVSKAFTKYTNGINCEIRTRWAN